MSVPNPLVAVNGYAQLSSDNINTFVQNVFNVANLRNFVGITNMEVSLQGYTTAGDGGQGMFYWNGTTTGTDDGGVTTVVPNGVTIGCWSRISTTSSGRILITSPQSYFVNTSTGSNSNNGLTQSTAWLTVQHAIIYIAENLICNAQVTVYVAGSCSENLALYQWVGWWNGNNNCPIITNDSSNQTQVTYSASSGVSISGVAITSPWVFQNAKLTNSTSNNIVQADWGTVIYLVTPEFGSSTSGNHMVAEFNGSRIEILNSGYKISGGASTHAYAVHGGTIIGQGGTTTITNTPYFPGGFAQSSDSCSFISFESNTFSGSATGPQAIMNFGGQIINPSSLPGGSVVQNNDYVSSSVSSGSAVSLTNNSPYNITSISLTTGEWDVWFECVFAGASNTTVTALMAGISLSSATLPAPDNGSYRIFLNGATPFNATSINSLVGPSRLLINTALAPLTVYAVALAQFGTSTCNAYGLLRARRYQHY